MIPAILQSVGTREFHPFVTSHRIDCVFFAGISVALTFYHQVAFFPPFSVAATGFRLSSSSPASLHSPLFRTFSLQLRSDEPALEEDAFHWLAFAAGVLLVSAIKFAGIDDLQRQVLRGINAATCSPRESLDATSSLVSFLSAFFYSVSSSQLSIDGIGVFPSSPSLHHLHHIPPCTRSPRQRVAKHHAFHPPAIAPPPARRSRNDVGDGHR